MTNKLEEVLKELQESHVLVDREEYEKLVDGAETKKSKSKNRYDELLEKFEISKSEMNKEELQGFAKSVLKYASSNERANEYIDQLLADILEKEKEAEIEEEPKFLIGEYYTIGLDANSREIFMVISSEDKLKAKSYRVSYDHFRVMSTDLKGNSFVVTDSKLATDEEANLFKRAEMYHKHNRKLDELKIGDLMKSYNSQSPFALEYERDIEIWSGDESLELYLTVEEQREAYKKIVGE